MSLLLMKKLIVFPHIWSLPPHQNLKQTKNLLISSWPNQHIKKICTNAINISIFRVTRDNFYITGQRGKSKP